MQTIKQIYLIAASPAEVWRALTDPEMIAEWSGADAVFEPTVGAEYELWDDSFCGKIVEAIPNQKLVQTWQPNYWETEDSVVTFTLTPVGDKTRVALLHENVEERGLGVVLSRRDQADVGRTHTEEKTGERETRKENQSREKATVHTQKENAQEEITESKLLQRESTRAPLLADWKSAAQEDENRLPPILWYTPRRFQRN
jgi:uncharacterized protein YndB with AHSA1/START domain